MKEKSIFPILESYPPNHFDLSNRINQRMVMRQAQIDALQTLQNQDRVELGRVQEAMRFQMKQGMRPKRL